MASLEEIQNYLNIDIDEPLRDGLKNHKKTNTIIIMINITSLNYHRIGGQY